MDRRYARRRSRDEDHYTKNGSSMPVQNYAVSSSRNSSKEKKGSTDQVKLPIRTLGDWSEFLSSSGKIYFYNQKTEKTQWEKPEEWDWLIQKEEKTTDKNYYSKDYKNTSNNNPGYMDNRYRNKYDQFDSSNKRYNENYKNYQPDYPNDMNNSSSNYNQSFRQNSYNNSYDTNNPNNMYDQSGNNRMYPNNNSNLQSAGAGGPISSGYNDSYNNNNYRNYEPGHYNNDQRMSNHKNNINFNRDSGPNKPYLPYQKQHTSRYETYNDNESGGRYPSDQYGNSNSMYNNHQNSNNYYNNTNTYPPNNSDYEMRDKYSKSSQSRGDHNSQFQEKNVSDYTANPNNNNNNISRSNSRSKSSSNLSRSRSRSSSGHKTRSSSNSSTSSQSKSKSSSKSNSHKRLKSDHNKLTDKNNKNFISNNNNNSPNHNHHHNYNNQHLNNQNSESNKLKDINSEDARNNHDFNSKNGHHIEYKDNNQYSQEQSDNLSKHNGNEKNKDRDEKMHDDHIKSSPKSLDKKEIKVDMRSADFNAQHLTETLVNKSEGQNKPSEGTSSSFADPVLASTIEDINKYYKPDLLYRLTGIDLNENLNGINSQIILKQMNNTSMGADLKNYRALVRLKEIKKTVQEQRLIFLQTQMKEIEELLN